MKQVLFLCGVVFLVAAGAGCSSRADQSRARAEKASSEIRVGQPPAPPAPPQQAPMIPSEAKNIPRPQ